MTTVSGRRSRRRNAQRSARSRSTVQTTSAFAPSSEDDDDIPSQLPSQVTGNSPKRHPRPFDLSLSQSRDLPYGAASGSSSFKRQRTPYSPISTEQENDLGIAGAHVQRENPAPGVEPSLFVDNEQHSGDSPADWFGTTIQRLEEQLTGPDGAHILESSSRLGSQAGLRMLTLSGHVDQHGEEDDEDDEDDQAMAPADRGGSEGRDSSQRERVYDAQALSNKPDHQDTALHQDIYLFDDDTDEHNPVQRHSNRQHAQSNHISLSSRSDDNSDSDSSEPPQVEASQHSVPAWKTSDYFRPTPGRPGNVPSVELSSIELGHMLNYMSRGGWTDSKRWKHNGLFGILSTRQTIRGSIQEHLKELLKYAGSLYRLCSQIPPMADHCAQNTRLQQEQTVQDFANRLHAIDLYTNKTTRKFATRIHSTNNDDQRDAAQAAQRLYRMVIPSMVLLLERAFIMGSVQSQRDVEQFPDSGKFSLATVQILLRVTEWIRTLYAAVQSGPQQGEARTGGGDTLQEHKQHRHLFGKPLEKFSKSVQEAFTELGGRQDEQHRARQVAMENDRLARQAREQELQHRQNAKEKQMELFFASIQKLPLSRQMESRYTVEPSASSSSRITFDNRPGSQTRKRKARPNEAYAQKNGGWSWDEDYKLLTMIRSTNQPEIIELAVEFGRGLDAVQDRIDHLKGLAREKFRQTNEPPPAWWSF